MKRGTTDLPLSPSHTDFTATGLKVPSVVKCDKLATLHRHILLGELGILSASLTEIIDACLRSSMCPSAKDTFYRFRIC